MASFTSGERRGLIILALLLIISAFVLAIHDGWLLPSADDSPDRSLTSLTVDSVCRSDSLMSAPLTIKTTPRPKSEPISLPQRSPLDEPIN